MDGPEGPRVTGPEEMAGRFHAELIVAVPGEQGPRSPCRVHGRWGQR